jgi:type II secretory pathway pseudopilin PulG
MTAHPTTFNPTAPRRLTRAAGFTFTEVLFAVMILGIGFIMIAGIFPVSLTQVKLTNEESTAAAVARGATAFLQRQAEIADGISGDDIFRPTIPLASRPVLTAGQFRFVYGQVWSLYDSRMRDPHQSVFPEAATPPPYPPTRFYPAQKDLCWGSVGGNAIFPTDPRYAWVAVYRRDATYVGVLDTNGAAKTIEIPAAYAQVTIVPVAARNRSIFSKADDVDLTPKNLAAREATGTFAVDATTGVSSVTLTGADAGAAAEGGYVIVSADTSSGVPGWMNGRIYRLGVRDAAPTPIKFDLVPGSDFQKDPGPDGEIGNADDIASISGSVLLVGRGYVDGQFEGPAMDVSVFTTYVKVN